MILPEAYYPQRFTGNSNDKRTKEMKGMNKMKNMKRIAALLLALLLVLAMIPAAFAEEEPGSITIQNVSDGNTYTIYKLLDLVSYNVDSSAYSYKVATAWNGFFVTDAAKAYMQVDSAGTVTWIGGDTDTAAAAFAKLAMDYAKTNSIADQGQITPDADDTTIIFNGLDLGYYLVDSTMGSLCGLTTTNPNAFITAKNAEPTLEKNVFEDSTKQWTTHNSEDIGNEVSFRTTIKVHAGAQNYVLHDVMEPGLTFGAVTEVKHFVSATNTEETATPATPATPGATADYTVNTSGLTDGCSFEIIFSPAFCDHLATNDQIIVYYSATLNENAEIYENSNDNTTWLAFGEDHETEKSVTHTYTFAFDLVKTDDNSKLLEGAEFKLYDALTGGEMINVVRVGDKTYRRATTKDKSSSYAESIVVTDGRVRLIGFDNGSYYLEETKTPDGYNQLTARHPLTISDTNLDASVNTDGIATTGKGVVVMNKKGNILPQTGGIGTTLFYVVGGVLVAAAVVLLVTRKRMSDK